MQDCIATLTAKDFLNWKSKHPDMKRQTLDYLVYNIDTAVKHIFYSNAEQPAQHGIPFEVLIGWLIMKCDENAEKILAALDILCDLAEDVYRVCRIRKIVERADDIREEE